MIKTGRLLALASALAVGLPAAAYADGFQSYKVCGGLNFSTCAAVSINVVGSSVTVRVWNLSGNGAATYGVGSTVAANTVFNGIGFYNTGGVSAVSGTLQTTGPVRAGDTPSGWGLQNNATLGFSVDWKTISPGKGGANGIASGCAAIPTNIEVWQNPCTGNLGNTADYVTFSFQISGTWDPTTSDVVLRGINPVSGSSTECWTGNSPNGAPSTCTTVTPEPVTMSLLATGLAGMGGAGFLRRRKQKQTA
ncbi:MAG: PEP-CTERM sorting domain-containing protein [Gemmatimonadetes bacterium]|nr:PEP-CTERM sorting domain-containing protein [Gemmatimonadota bacterium]